VFGKATLNKVSRTPFDGLPSLKGDFDSLYATILHKAINVSSLESKVEGLIKQACDFKNLQQSYSVWTSAEEYDSCRTEVQGKLDEASRRLNTEGAHYEARAARLKQVELRCEKLLKELQLVEDQKKYLSSHVAASEYFFKKLSRKLLTCQIDILNATVVTNAAKKPSLENTEAYIKEFFEDLNNF